MRDSWVRSVLDECVVMLWVRKFIIMFINRKQYTNLQGISNIFQVFFTQNNNMLSNNRIKASLAFYKFRRK